MQTEAKPSSSLSSRKTPNPLLVGAVSAVLGVGVGTWYGGRRAAADANVVTINGAAISKNDFLHRMELSTGKQALQQISEEELVLQFARKQGVMPSDAEVESRYAEVAKQQGFEDNLKKTMQTPEDIKRNIRVQMAREATINKGVNVTEEEVQEFYRNNTEKKYLKALYYQPETVQIAAILTETEEEAKKAQADLARSVAFAEVAAKYSRDASKQNGGVLPPIQKGRWDSSKLPGLQEKVFTMKVGDQTAPLKFGGKWWIIRCLGTAPETTVPFEKVKEDCRKGAMLTKGLKTNAANLLKEFEEFKKGADIQVIRPQYSDFAPKK